MEDLLYHPALRILFAFLVALIGFESLAGLVYLFISHDKLFELAVWGGLLGACWIAYEVQFRLPTDPMQMGPAERRAYLRRVRRQLDKQARRN